MLKPESEPDYFIFMLLPNIKALISQKLLCENLFLVVITSDLKS